MPRYGGFLGLDWENVGRFQRNLNLSKEYLDDLQKTFIHWFHGSGALSKKMADHFTAYVRARILSQQAFQGMPALSPMWAEMKNKQGFDPRIGIAKGYLAEAIDAINTGYSKYRVGISKNKTAPDAAGSIKNIATYAILLEKGWTSVGSSGERRHQPPRPFFGTSFMKWTKDNLPKHIRDSIWKDMWPEMQRLYSVMGESVPSGLEPEDLYTIDYAGEGATAAQEIFQESTQAGGTTYGQAPSEFTGEGAESSELRPTDVGSGRGEFVRRYSESERTESYMEVQGRWMTESGDVFDTDEGKWVDIESYYNKHFGGF